MRVVDVARCMQYLLINCNVTPLPLESTNLRGTTGSCIVLSKVFRKLFFSGLLLKFLFQKSLVSHTRRPESDLTNDTVNPLLHFQNLPFQNLCPSHHIRLVIFLLRLHWVKPHFSQQGSVVLTLFSSKVSFGL